MQEFRALVSKLDSTSSKQVEEQAVKLTKVISEQLRYAVIIRTAVPQAMATVNDQGPAGIFLTQVTVQRLVRARQARRASALIPNAALNAARALPSLLALLTSCCDLALAAVQVGDRPEVRDELRVAAAVRT